MLDKYWPDNIQISNCIRSEAEELSSYVLQVVHEPMYLRKFDINNGNSNLIHVNAEDKLLEHLKLHSRPIPILGDAGSGKSHLIRLLDVQLKNTPETQDWIVKRIPKSSSLRQVLEILLEGMHGENFDTLRKNIKEVGDKLDTEEVAEHLIVFMSNRLKELHDSMQQTLDGIKKSGRKVSKEDEVNLKRLKQHAPSNQLPSLLGDPNFKDRLIRPGRCLYNIAKRLTSGSSESETKENDYLITEADLDLESVIIDDFSSNTKKYIQTQQLKTNSNKRKEVVDLLNEILSDACRIAFQRFFHFNGGQFQDLFVDIRKKLIGKTLVILVEDMAAITAIENDLIDSLLLESTRDGEQELCIVKSAIAVTTGYDGYQRRRNTITTRSGAIEWYIEKKTGNDNEIYKRVENFCGRYLNASRYELSEIKQLVEENSLPLPPWKDHSLDDLSFGKLESFGISSQKYPLFPYNRASLKALTDLNCRNTSGELEFNPRRVLLHILIPILRNYREKFLLGTFPPPNFLGLSSSSNLQGQVRVSDRTKVEQTLSAMAFWGYEAINKGTLVSIMPPAIASVMGMEELAQLLGDTAPVVPTPTPIVPTPTPTVPTPTVPTPPLELNRFRDVDDAFKTKFINQGMAKIIRNELFEILQAELPYMKKWNGISADIKSLIFSRQPLIKIPYNSNNPNKTYAEFGNEKIFLDNTLSLKYKQFIIAVLKRNDLGGWDESLYEDYCRYQNFAKEWACDIIPNIIAQIQKERLTDALKPAVKIASTIHPSFITSTYEEKLNILCSHSVNWKKELLSCSGQEEWDRHRNSLIETWDNFRMEWIKYVAINDHGLSRDIVISHLRSIDSKNISDPLAQKTQKNIIVKYSNTFELLMGCNNKETFIDAFDKMRILISKMNQSGQFKYPNNELTSRKIINRIEKVISDESLSRHWSATVKLLTLLGPFTLDSFIKAISQFNCSDLEPVEEALQSWQQIYKLNSLNYNDINLINDSASRVVKEDNLLKKLHQTKDTLTALIPEQEALSDGTS
jgi:hypothetical protein